MRLGDPTRHPEGNVMKAMVVVSSLVVFASLQMVATSVQAASLYWSKFPVKTQSEKTCMRFAGDVARQHGLQNIRTIPIEVAGAKGKAYVSMTCVGRGGGQSAIGMVMVMSDEAGTATALRDELATAFKGIICFDNC